ncbi:MAG: YciI family protein [Nitrospiraceae bacterium]
MKYLCLIYEEEAKLRALSKAELDALMVEHVAVTADIQKSGHYRCGEILQPADRAATVRVRSGIVFTTDGPLAATKEQLGGFYLIDARDLNEAIQVAAKLPSARLGTIEVRPVLEV